MGAHLYGIGSWVFVLVACMVALALGVGIPALARRTSSRRPSPPRFR